MNPDPLALFDTLSPDYTARTVSGTVAHLNYESPTWCAGRLAPADGGASVSFSVKASVKVGDSVELRGEWVDKPVYRWSFVATHAIISLPLTAAGIVAWLRWNAEGIGEKRAQRLVDRYGADTISRMELDPVGVAAFLRVPPQAIRGAAEQWRATQAKSQAIAAIAEHGLTQAQCEAIFAEYGTGALNVIERDPYELAGNVTGIGFKLADEIAAKFGIVGHDPRRLRGGLVAYVRERYQSGHTATPLPVALQRTADLLETSPEVIREEVDAVTGGSRPRVLRLGHGHDERDVLTTHWAERCERGVWDVLRTARGANPLRPCREGEEAAHAEGYRHCGEIVLDDSQLAAVVGALKYRITVLTGSAGSGKTASLRAIIKAFMPAFPNVVTTEDLERYVFLCAPTGKAARRISEVIGLRAQTIHRLLQWEGRASSFHFNSSHRLPRGLYCVDETGMSDSGLMYSFLSALPDSAAVVLVGDTQQLPPVGPGAVLRDILTHGLTPVTTLEKCHRQAGTLRLNTSALLAGIVAKTVPSQTGGAPAWVVDDTCGTDKKTLDTIFDLYTRVMPQWGYGATEWVFLAPKIDGPLGVKRINLVLQYLHQHKLGNKVPHPGMSQDDWQKRPTFYVGDRVLATKNDYNLHYQPPATTRDPNPAMRQGIMNGTTGVVVGVEPLRVVYDDAGEVEYGSRAAANDVQLAYCLTTHRMQGSQNKCVVTVMPKGSSGFATRNWVYTSVSRAQNTSVLIGDGPTIRQAVQRVGDDERDTVLRFLAENREGEE